MVSLSPASSLLDLLEWLTGTHIGLVYNVGQICLGTPCDIVVNIHNPCLVGDS